MPRYAPWIVAFSALALALFIYFENRRLMRNLEKITHATLPPPTASRDDRLGAPRTPVASADE
ncbi:MAG: hypothetical protein N2Z21_10680, partial [Candidatus Sumerlaeaceae bacterium]|nr:hypothetical protein [Candidatus Sumerlaeaceae bacterium]